MIIFFSRLQSLPLFQSFFFFRWAQHLSMLLKEAEDRGRGLEVPDDEKKNGRGLSPTDAEAETKGQDRFTSSCPVAKNQTWVCVRISWRLTHFLTYSLTHPISLLQLQKGIRDLKSCLFCCCCCCLEKKNPHWLVFHLFSEYIKIQSISDFIIWNWLNCPQRMPNNQSQRSRPVLRYTTVAIWIFHTPSFICPRSKTTEKTNLMEFKVIEGHF